MRKQFIYLLIFTVCLVGFYKLGRSVWHPVYVKVAGKRTSAGVIELLAKTRFGSIKTGRYRNLRIIILKEERSLELWGEAVQTKQFEMIKAFPFTAFSGTLGPKLKEGDGQIPEGVYGIEYLNPNSSYHLSMKLTYPNDFDRAMAKKDGRKNLGDDIFIHGKDVTIGCVPLGDEAIEEVFYWVYKIGKDNVKVISLPYDMRISERKLEIPRIDWETKLYDSLRNEINL